MSSNRIIPEIRMDNLANFGSDVFTAFPKLIGNTWATGYDAIKGPLSESVGIESEAQRTEREKKEGASAESAARASFYNDAISSRDIDSTTRSEIEGLYQSGASAATIAAVLSQAKDGKGLYGIRRVNANAAAQRADTPGRAQLRPTLGVNGTSTLGSSTVTGSRGY
jgi:hypothetical protein